AILLTACVAPTSPSPEPPDECDRTYFVSEEFTDAQQGAIATAAYRWNEHTVEKVCVVVGDSRGYRGIFPIEYGGAYWQKISADFNGANVLGVHFGGIDRIGVVTNLDEATFELVAL